MTVDRNAYVWAVRVRYIDMDTDEVFWNSGYLDPDTATYAAVDSCTPNTLGSHAFAQSNSDPHPTDPNLADGFRVTEWLDGVAVTQNHDSSAFISTAFDRMMEHACDHLHNAYSTAKGCLVDEAGATYGNGDNSETVYDSYPPADALSRMQVADTHGDGVLSTYLPLAVENVGLGWGRFTERAPLDSSYETLVVEPRLTRTLIGERHEWSWTVPSGCGGDYTVNFSKRDEGTGASG